MQCEIYSLWRILCVCVCSEGRPGFAAAEDDEWSPALELEGVGMMDLPNGQSSITTTVATLSEVRPRPLVGPPSTPLKKLILCILFPTLSLVECFFLT